MAVAFVLQGLLYVEATVAAHELTTEVPTAYPELPWTSISYSGVEGSVRQHIQCIS